MLFPKGVDLPISKLHSILPVENLLAHSNISQICCCGQISLQRAAVITTVLSDNLTCLGVTSIFLTMVHIDCNQYLPYNIHSTLPYKVVFVLFYDLKYKDK